MRIIAGERKGMRLEAPAGTAVRPTSDKLRGAVMSQLGGFFDGERVLVVASKGGMPEHPAWYKNLVADPDVTIELGNEKRAMRARTATPDEKTAYWPKLVAMYADYDAYQAKTAREIPVVVLEPAAR